jgi:hypothetical protein
MVGMVILGEIVILVEMVISVEIAILVERARLIDMAILGEVIGVQSEIPHTALWLSNLHYIGGGS